MRSLITKVLRETLTGQDRGRYCQVYDTMFFLEHKDGNPSKRTLGQYDPKTFKYEDLSDETLFSLYEVFTYKRANQR